MGKFNTLVNLIKDNRVKIISKTIQVAVVGTAYAVTTAIIRKPETIVVNVFNEETDGPKGTDESGPAV